MAHPPPAGSSSPGPHSLGVPTVKKKSGFQITSVLPAQVSSASANNSIADDTESYDDMDESHTEDLSSSDILDVSVSRATDTGVPERSSSEETLNSLHGGETPGVASPNEPVMHQGYLVNGVHHHHHHHHKTGRSVAPSATPSAIPVVPQAPAPSGRSVQAEACGSASSSVSVATDSAAGATMPLASANPSTTASRFRVVKLDSSSEPFRKGRWTCTEFYEKDAPPGDVASVASVAHRAVESVIQSEHETTSGSSSGSTLSGGGDVQQVCAHLVPPTESSSAPVRSYGVEPQSSYTPVEYAQIAANVQPLLIPNAVSPRAAPVSIGIPGPVSPRPPQMGINPDQPGAQLSSSHSSAQSDLQPLRAPLHLAGPACVTASQLEDAQRLLLQHHTLLSLAAGGRAGPVAALGQDSAAGAFTVSTGADEDSSSGASVVAIDNKIEQAMLHPLMKNVLFLCGPEDQQPKDCTQNPDR
ncbi:TSC22 domain family protein 1-like isoform X3 [Sinocyclocheilus anshuiensis]|uniref:TSC22 domain family protein 1-like isoform X3 n=1 Tax=Sinocyclocheilus anshuiensis TaxID=1608454 RepID=UPI0007B8FA84|nr:PREDICTED: TSC22 domain family protein 1-like isoform X3 [Sinocyclocheilus anshuiensis]